MQAVHGGPPLQFSIPFPPLSAPACPALQDNSRREAEVQYKRCMALQFLDRHQEALEAVKAAVAGLEARSARLKERLVAEESDEVCWARGRTDWGWEWHSRIGALSGGLTMGLIGEVVRGG